MTDIDYNAENAAMIATLRARTGDGPVYDVYARISKKNSDNDEDKTERQVWRGLKRLLTMPDARLGEVLVDEARSAWKANGKRPAFNALLTRATERHAQGVILRFADRLARQPWDGEQIIRVGEPVGYIVVTHYETFDLGDWRNVEALRREFIAAQRESAIKSERVRDTVEVRLAKGDDRNGPAPFGWAWGGEHPTEQVEAERAAIVWGIEQVVAGKSWGYVAAEFNDRGLRPRRGGRFNSLGVRQVLTLPRHAGHVTHRGKVIANTGAGFVPAALYDALMLTLDGRKTGGRPSGETGRFLSGTIRCGSCGRRMVAGGGMYRCPPQGCRGVSVDATWAETWAGHEVERVLTAPENVALLARRSVALAEVIERRRLVEDAIEGLEAQQRAAHPTRRARYAPDLADLEAQLTPLIDEQDALEAARLVRGTPADVEAVRRDWADATPEQRRILARQAFPLGFHVEACGRSARLRGRDLLTRFALGRGEASPHREKDCPGGCAAHR